MSAGVAVGALVLEIQRHGRADMAVESSDFITAFVVVGLDLRRVGLRLHEAAEKRRR